MGPENFGVYVLAFAILMALCSICQLGLPQLIVRESAKYRYLEYWSYISGLWRWAMFVCLGSIFVVSFIVVIVLHYFDSGVFTMLQRTILVGLIFLPFYIFNTLKGAALQGVGAPISGQMGDKVIRPGLFLILLYAYPRLARDAAIDPASILLMHAVAVAFAGASTAYLLIRLKPKALALVKTLSYERARWLSAVVPLGFVSLFGLINQQADILVLGVFENTETVGIYRAAWSIAALVSFGLQAISAVLAPHYARLYSKKDLAKLQLYSSRSALILTLLAIPVVAIFFLYGREVLEQTFGLDYVSGYVALLLLALAQLFNVMMGPVGVLLNMTGHEKETLRGLAISAFVNIGLNFILIPMYGIEGAAIATVLSLVIWNALLLRAVKRDLGINCSVVGVRW